MTLPDLDVFQAFPPPQRSPLLLEGIRASHVHHFRHNAAYRRTLSARGVGEISGPEEISRLLRPASLTFKSYVETIGPFPQDAPVRFVDWLRDQISIPLPDRAASFRKRYLSLEGLLKAVEGVYADIGLEIVTSSGTSGIASVVARDSATVSLAVHSFFTGIRHAWGMSRDVAMVFVMPEDTRVAMARSARIGTSQLDWAAHTAVHYTMPFAATPDRIRLRAGRLLRPGLWGGLERHILHPAMAFADRAFVARRYVGLTLATLRNLAEKDHPLMLLGGLAQLHRVALEGSLSLPAGSRVATGGGSKEHYPFTPADIRDDLAQAFGAPVSDVYGMAEADWAAFECPLGHHHIPPWVYAVVTDDDDAVLSAPVATGMLAFFDPVAGGDLLPPFFQTADHVTLVNGGSTYDPSLVGACGYDSPYISSPIRRLDLADEAGCAAQL
jgi:hypothetical protein